MTHRTQATSANQAQGPPNRRQPFPTIPGSLVLSMSIAEALRQPSQALDSAERTALHDAIGITQIQATAMPPALAELKIKAIGGRTSMGA